MNELVESLKLCLYSAFIFLILTDETFRSPLVSNTKGPDSVGSVRRGGGGEWENKQTNKHTGFY